MHPAAPTPGCPQHMTLPVVRSIYGENFVDQSLDKGVGALVDLKMYLQSKAHPGYPYSSPLHSWVACANNVTSGAPQFYWYVVASCANAAHDANKTFEECAATVPAAAVQVRTAL